MLIPNQITKMKWHSRNKDYYTNLGYTFTKMGDEFDVRVEDLTIGAKSIVKIRCDYCGNIFNRRYQNHINQYSSHIGDSCTKCKTKKVMESNVENYGVENILQLDEIKEKVRDVNIEKYGVPYYSSTEECKKKCEDTRIKRYGKAYYMQTDEYWEKYRKTCLNKYGVEHASKNNEVIAKIKKTQHDKYDGIGFGSDEVCKKIRNTCNEKYGVEFPANSDNIKEKIKETNIKKYGCPYVLQNKIIRKKIAETNIKKYGFIFPTQSPQVQEKTRKTFYKNGITKTSSQQMKVYEILKEYFEICELNYPCGRCSLDCFIKVNDCLIDIEYDGFYWHQDKRADFKRDMFVKSKGYKVLRIKGRYTVPTKEQLIEAIDYLVKGNHSYTEILLDI